MRALLGAALAITGCYSPELRDCTVTCGGSTECADDQVCGSDGYCAAPEVAGTCGDGPGPGPAPALALRTRVDGRGSVEVAGVGTCDDDCTWQIAPGTTVQLRAIDGDQKFDKWTTPNCAMQAATCTLALTAAAIVGVKFH